MTPRPFTVRVPDEVLADLRTRLERVRWPDEIAGEGWRYGTSLAYMKELVAYWRDGYDWRAQEARLNELPQFTCRWATWICTSSTPRVSGRAPAPARLPRVAGVGVGVPQADPPPHGPGPVRRRSGDAFTVVAPSLPGYGYSFPTEPAALRRPRDRRALRPAHDGRARLPALRRPWRRLGAFVTARLGLACPDRLVGIHVTLLGLRRDLPPPRTRRRRTERISKPCSTGSARRRAISGSRARGPRPSPTG